MMSSQNTPPALGHPAATLLILDEVRLERDRQQDKWGVQRHASIAPTLLSKDGGCSSECIAKEYEIPTEERAKLLCETAFSGNVGTWAHIMVEEVSEAVCSPDEDVMRAELIQVAAVAVAWIEDIDRRIAASKGFAPAEEAAAA